MSISKVIKETMKRSSWIRKMFEEGERMKAEGKPVYDFSLGNPDLDPPPAFKKEWSKLLKDTPPGQHRYMTNNGYPQVRTDIADYLHDITIGVCSGTRIMASESAISRTYICT